MATTRRALLLGTAASAGALPADGAAGKLRDARETPAHSGAHPDDPGLPAVDPLVVLLNRGSYGIRAADWAEAQSLGVQGWLERQLYPQALDTAALDAHIATTYPRVAWSYAQLQADAIASQKFGTAFAELLGATLHRQLFSPCQLLEVMVEFWSDHFNVTAQGVPEVYYLVADNREVLRRHALGTFADLLKATARSLSMLYYLDNVLNQARGPNENYARELLELHTLGIDGGYSEADIKEVARCFTGWTVTGARSGAPAFAFVPSLHDDGSKQVLGNALAAGGGISDGERVLDLLAQHPATARHIAKKLCIRFVADSPQDSVIDAVAATYTASGGDIRAMLRTLFASSEFQTSYDRKLRRPLEYVLACLRVVDASLVGSYQTAVVNRLNALGQVPMRWPTPDGYPDSMAEWLSSGGMLTRWNWAFAVAEDRAHAGIRIDPSALLGSAQTPAQLVDGLSARLLRRTLASADRERLLVFAAAGGSADAVLPTATLLARARELIGALLASAYFQYR